ncbi:MAG: hypothetical protein COB23_10200 [Methylophaga sp.]|nr:MAG: hypothetical protein COB23_10200 [Methylophaga sp.]
MNIGSTTTTVPLTANADKRIPTVTPANKESTELSTQEQQQIQQLQARDRVVRAHEAAHIAAGGNVIRGGAQFSFQRGPNGVQYAVGGEVKIDTSKVKGDPEATLRKAEQIRAAALAPAQPSSQDRAVAANAAQLAVEARAEINQQRNVAEPEDTELSSNTSDTQPSAGRLLDFTV